MSRLEQFQFKGRIHSIKSNYSNKCLSIESINTDRIKSLTILDTDTYKLTELDVYMNISGGVSQHSFIDDYLILTEHAANSNPDQMRIMAFSIRNNQIQWQLEASQILSIGENFIEIPHPMFVGKTARIDLKTGKDLKESGGNYISHLNNNIVLPLLYKHDSEHFRLFEKFIQKRLELNPVLECEYIETESNMIISFYAQNDELLKNIMLIANKNGSIIDQIVLEENLKGIGRDTFFILDNRLIFVSNKDTLNIYEL